MQPTTEHGRTARQLANRSGWPTCLLIVHLFDALLRKESHLVASRLLVVDGTDETLAKKGAV